MAAPKWNKGADKAQQASEASGGGARGPRVNYFSLKNSGDQAILRFLTEAPDWITVNQHMYIPPQRPGLKNPPKSLSTVCRHDEQFLDMYSDCYICDNKLQNLYGKQSSPTPRVWALACEREEILADEALIAASHKPDWQGEPIPSEALGTAVGMLDKVRDVTELGPDKKPTGRTIQEKSLVVVNMSYKNFFGALHGCYLAYRTVRDRDYTIRRAGTGTDVEYHPIPLDPIATRKPGQAAWNEYEEAIKAQGLDLGEIIVQRTSDEYYEHFFDITKPDPWARKDEDQSTPQAVGAPLSQQVVTPDALDQGMLDAMRARLASSVSDSSQ